MVLSSRIDGFGSDDPKQIHMTMAHHMVPLIGTGMIPLRVDILKTHGSNSISMTFTFFPKPAI